MPKLKSEIKAMQREIQRGRAATEYERMHSTNFELSEAMDKHMISTSCESESLRYELANAEKRAMTMAAISAIHPGPGESHVGMADIVSAIKEMFQAPHIKVIRSCSKLSKIFLAAMVYELCKTRIGETTFEKDEDNGLE